jgi:hypothetical protein
MDQREFTTAISREPNQSGSIPGKAVDLAKDNGTEEAYPST